MKVYCTRDFPPPCCDTVFLFKKKPRRGRVPPSFSLTFGYSVFAAAFPSKDNKTNQTVGGVARSGDAAAARFSVEGEHLATAREEFYNLASGVFLPFRSVVIRPFGEITTP